MRQEQKSKTGQDSGHKTSGQVDIKRLIHEGNEYAKRELRPENREELIKALLPERPKARQRTSAEKSKP